MDIKEARQELKKDCDAKKAGIENEKLGSHGHSYSMGYRQACTKAIALLDEVDNRVVVPQFVANWIVKSARECDYEPIRMAEWIADNIHEGTDYHFDWLENPDNQRLLLKALINNYEVEKEPKYRVKLPGLAGSNGQQYISKSADGRLFAYAQRSYLQQEFTREELRHFPDWAQQLEFEEVEDDD